LGAGVDDFVSADGPLIFDQKIGHYRDVFYGALGYEDVTWQQRTGLFGGESVHSGELTDEERKIKENRIEAMLATIEMRENNNWADPNSVAPDRWPDEHRPEVVPHETGWCARELDSAHEMACGQK